VANGEKPQVRLELCRSRLDSKINQCKALKAQLDRIKKDLECSFCLNTFIQPVTLACGHSFCRTCALQYFARNNLSCGVCRSQEISQHPLDLKVNVHLDSLASQLNGQFARFNHEKDEG